MTLMVRHRGPDDEGYLLANTRTGGYLEFSGPDTVPELKKDLPPLKGPNEIRANLALGHRRLSVIDVSASGHQPIANEDGTMWTVSNGEIYNFRELRVELEGRGHQFGSNTDVETLIHGYEEWGIEGCLAKLMGMLAFILWDKEKQRMYAVRDRFGIKPLYYSIHGDVFLTASEAKSLLLAVPREPNHRYIYRYLTFQRPQISRETFFNGIHQVKPAHYLTIDLDTREVDEKNYWSPKFTKGISSTNVDAYYTEKWKEAFFRTIALHLRADVPVGFLLSGGIDSTSIAAVSKKLIETGSIDEKGLSEGKLSAFSSWVRDQRINEEEFAKHAGSLLGLQLYSTVPDPNELWEEMPKLVWHQDEPPEGPSVYAQWCVMRLASKHAKVVLDGQGGDELLGGYHFYIPIYLSELAREREMSKFLGGLWNLRDMIFSKLTLGLSVFLGSRERFLKRILHPDYVEKYARPVPPEGKPKGLNQALCMDLTGGRLHEMLRYEDRNSMAFSIESRVPFLHHELAELSLAFPEDQKIRGKWTKYMHRNAMKDIIPERIRLRRDKIGFEVPEAKWLMELKDQIRELLKDPLLASRGIFNQKALLSMYDRMIEGSLGAEYARVFWRVVFLEFWFRTFIDRIPQVQGIALD